MCVQWQSAVLQCSSRVSHSKCKKNFTQIILGLYVLPQKVCELQQKQLCNQRALNIKCKHEVVLKEAVHCLFDLILTNISPFTQFIPLLPQIKPTN